MQVTRKILALTLALTLMLSVGMMTAAAGDIGLVQGQDGVMSVGASAVKTLTITAAPGISGTTTITVTSPDTTKKYGARISQRANRTPKVGDTAPSLRGLDNRRAIVGWYVNVYESVKATGEITGFVAHELVQGEVEGTLLPDADLLGLVYHAGKLDEQGDMIFKEVPNVEATKMNYTVNIPLGFSSVGLYVQTDIGATIVSTTGNGDWDAVATQEEPTVTFTIRAQDTVTTNTYTVTFTSNPAKNPETGGDEGSGGSNSNSNSNSANTPETAEKVTDVVAALADPTKALPKGAEKLITAGGASVTTIPVALTSGSATVGMDLFNSLGNAPASVGIKFTVRSSIFGGAMKVILPGGFGKNREVGRFAYSMDYEDKAASNDDMLKAVKDATATSCTAKVGGNQLLPTTATISVTSKFANGTVANIYHYNPHTGKYTFLGKSTAKDGELTFATKMMGEMLFTTATL